MKTKKKCKALVYDAVQSFKKIGLGWNMQSDEIKLIKERGLKTDSTLPILQGLKTRGDLSLLFFTYRGYYRFLQLT